MLIISVAVERDLPAMSNFVNLDLIKWFKEKHSKPFIRALVMYVIILIIPSFVSYAVLRQANQLIPCANEKRFRATISFSNWTFPKKYPSDEILINEYEKYFIRKNKHQWSNNWQSKECRIMICEYFPLWNVQVRW